MYSNNIQRIQDRYVGFLQIYTTHGVDEYPLKEEEIADIISHIRKYSIKGSCLDDSGNAVAGMYKLPCRIGDLDRFSDKFHPLVWAYKRSEIITSCIIVLYNEVLHEKLSKSN